MDTTQNTKSSPGPTIDVMNDLIPNLKAINTTGSKASSLTLLIITIFLFFSAQIISTKWQEILILIGVLLFHELGHLAAMKLLKYSDVKMFFIPFIGAAVSGKSRNDSALKSCMVSLMGPFPGILMGMFLYFLFILTKNYFLFKTAQVMLLLNAFNFLPIMPLDGGRYIDVLFVNRRYFRFLLALFGAVVFLLLASSAKDIVMGVLGVFAMYAALANLKLHRISNELKDRGVRAASVDELLEDQNAMQIMIDSLQTGYPKLFKPKVIYRSIYNQLTVIVETIKFIPAKLFSIIMLLFTYTFLLLISLLVSFLIIASNYQEKHRVMEIEGEKIAVIERHFFGRKYAECPVNGDLYYDGKGTAFGGEPDSISGIFYYSNGYRTGEWLTFDVSGEIVEKKNYDNGQLMEISRLEGDEWKTYSYKDLSFLQRCSEEIQRLSQPYKTYYKYF